MSSLIGLGRSLTPKNVITTVIAFNMVCRPAITLSNRQLPEDTRRYTALREFCTEVFGLLNTLTLSTAVEYLGPKLVQRDISRKAIDRLKQADWNKLTAKDQRLKSAVLVSSLVGSVVSLAFATPILNNLVLNRWLDKITGRQQRPVTNTTHSEQSLQQLQSPSYQALARQLRTRPSGGMASYHA